MQTAKAIGSNGKLPTTKSFYNIGEKLQLSALKKKEDSKNTVLRLYNPYGTLVREEVHLGFPIAKAWLLNLKEERQQEVSLQQGKLLIAVQPDEIQTIEIEIQQ